MAWFDFAKQKKIAFLTLDGFSKESFEEGLFQLEKVLKEKSGKEKLQTNPHFYPSVNFFIEAFNAQPVEIPIKTALLFFGSPEAEIVKKYAEGFRIFKLKFKVLNQEILKKLYSLFSHCPEILLRLDFNGSLKTEELKYLEALPMKNIDYIEEPCFNPIELAKKWPKKIAIDETFRKDPQISNPDLVYIIKPLLTPSFRKIIENRKKDKVIISSSFEMPCGINALKTIIYQHDLQHETHGLDTLKYYEMPVI